MRLAWTLGIKKPSHWLGFGILLFVPGLNFNGGGGIRTCGRFPFASFQDWSHQPLDHRSRPSAAVAAKAWDTVPCCGRSPSCAPPARVILLAVSWGDLVLGLAVLWSSAPVSGAQCRGRPGVISSQQRSRLRGRASLGHQCNQQGCCKQAMQEDVVTSRRRWPPVTSAHPASTRQGSRLSVR